MVGKKHQRHVCNMPYGDTDGTRLGNVGGKNKARKKKNFTLTLEQFHQLVWEDHSPQEIAKQMQVNPDIIINYFKDEGLI